MSSCILDNIRVWTHGWHDLAVALLDLLVEDLDDLISSRTQSPPMLGLHVEEDGGKDDQKHVVHLLLREQTRWMVFGLQVHVELIPKSGSERMCNIHSSSTYQIVRHPVNSQEIDNVPNDVHAPTRHTTDGIRLRLDQLARQIPIEGHELLHGLRFAVLQ